MNLDIILGTCLAVIVISVTSLVAFFSFATIFSFLGDLFRKDV